MSTSTTPGWDRAARESDLTLRLTDSVPLFFRLIQPGEFRMGSRGEYASEEPLHRVHITRAFYLGTFP